MKSPSSRSSFFIIFILHSKLLFVQFTGYWNSILRLHQFANIQCCVQFPMDWIGFDFLFVGLSINQCKNLKTTITTETDTYPFLISWMKTNKNESKWMMAIFEHIEWLFRRLNWQFKFNSIHWLIVQFHLAFKGVR